MNEFILIIGVGLSFALITFWAIIDAAQKDFGSIEHKAFWILVSAIPFIGFIIYLIFGYRKGRKPEKIISEK